MSTDCVLLSPLIIISIPKLFNGVDREILGYFGTKDEKM